MDNFRLRSVARGDVDALVAGMRLRDRAEVEAASGPDLYGSVSAAVRASDDCLTAELGGSVAAVFGIAMPSLLEGSAQPWMLGTTLMARLGRSLGLISRRYIAEASRSYPLLFNHVDARNAPSIRLIRWLGFTVLPAQPYGFAGLPFHRFELRSDQAQCAPATEQPRSPAPR